MRAYRLPVQDVDSGVSARIHPGLTSAAVRIALKLNVYAERVRAFVQAEQQIPIHRTILGKPHAHLRVGRQISRNVHVNRLLGKILDGADGSDAASTQDLE